MEYEPKKSSEPDAFAIYSRDLTCAEVMTAKEEIAAAERIRQLRMEFWDAALSYLPFAASMADLIEAKLEGVPAAELEGVRATSRQMRDRSTRFHASAFAAAIKCLSATLVEADADGTIATLVCQDLSCMASGSRERLHLHVEVPRKQSRVFPAYVARTLLAHDRLKCAKADFVTANLRLVVAIARRYMTIHSPLADLIQEGNLGLMKAVDRFDHRRGFRFSTYGSWWIRHAVQRSIADKGRSVRLPVHILDRQLKVKRARREFETLHGRAPTGAEVEALTGIPEAKIEKLAQLTTLPVPLDAPVGESGATYADLLPDGGADIERFSQLELYNKAIDVLGILTPVEADIIRKRFGLDDDKGLTLKEIGELYNLSRERIRQLQEQALRKIRAELKRRGWTEPR